MTRTNKQKLPALDNSGKVKNPDLATIGENNYTSTVLKYGSLAIKYPQLKTKDKTIVGAINEVQESGGGGSSTLAGLTDVDLQDPADGQVLSYNSTDSTWENSSIDYSDISNTPILATVATSGDYDDLTNKPTIPEDLADLDDVNITSPEDDQVLKYDATSGKWINSTGGGGGGASDLNDLDDVTITSPEENQVLKYDGSQWVNATSPAGATNLNGLTDVTIASPASGQALVYNSTSDEWENAAVDYSNIANKPTLATVATSGSYDDLTDKPTIPAAQVQADYGQTDNTKIDYIKNKPNLATVATSGDYTDLINKPTIPAEQVNSDWNASSGVAQILNKPNLAAVATSGSYSDLSNKPTIPAAQVNSDWNAVSGVAQILNKPNLATVATSGSYDDLTDKPTIPSAQVNSDWNSNSGVSQILNKPNLATVATTGAYSDLSGTPTLATVATSGSYSDLSNKPTIPDGLADLTDDVNISSPTNGQVLKYDSTSSKWVNGTGGGGSVDHITLTQAEYDALVIAGTVDPDAFYFISDGSPSAYSTTVLCDTPALFADNSEITLNRDFDKFDELKFYLCIYDSVLYNHFEVVTVPRDVLQQSYEDYNDSSISYQYKGRFEVSRLLYAGGWYVTSWQTIAKNKNTLLSGTKSVSGWSASQCYIYKIIGVNYDVVGGESHQYSTAEQVVGKWVDGSILYEKTIYNAGGTYGAISIAHNITNIGHCISAIGTCYDIGYPQGGIRIGAGDIPLSRVSYDGNNIGITGVNTTEIVFSVPPAFNDRITDIYITLRYTKSSS